MKKIYALALGVLISSSASAQTLVARYDFNNCSELDISGNGLHLTAGGRGTSVVSPVCTTGAAGKTGTARYFNDSNWYYTAQSSSLELDTWTLTAVVNFRSFSTRPCQVNYILGSNRGQGTDGHYSLETNDNNFDNSCGTISPNKQQLFGMSRNTPPPYNSYPSGHYLETNVWYCLTATYDGTNVTTYVDGSLFYTKAWSGNPKYSSPNPLLYIGMGLGGGSNPAYFDGRIDEVQIWSGVQSAAAISAACNAVKNPLSVKPGGASGQEIGAAYPNPVNDLLSIPVQGLQGEVGISIYAIDGRLLEHRIMNVTESTRQLLVGTDKLGPGTYILSINSGAEKVSRRFSKL